MGIELLSLALDGVMFDTEEAHLRACNAAFETCEMDLRWTAQQFRAAARTWGATNALRALTERIGMTAPVRAVDRLLQEKNELFHGFATELRPVLHPGCARLIEEALAIGCKLAVVTDMPAKTANALLDQAFGDAVNQRFAVVVSGAGFSEPSDNGPHHLAMRTAGVDAIHCAAIDAAAPGLNAAQRAGLWTIAATPYEKDVARITGADLWCPQLQELRELVGKHSAPNETAGPFVSFAMLRELKKRQMSDVPVLRQRPQLRRVA